jgi:hypothetical protein
MSHASAMAGVLSEAHRNPAIQAIFEREFLQQRKVLVQAMLRRAAGRGEIQLSAVSEEIWDVMPGYLVFRCLMPGRPPTADTVRAIVDEVLIPSLTRSDARCTTGVSGADPG